MIGRINFLLDKYLGIEVIKTRPKEAIKFAKEYFENKEIIAIEVGVFRGQNSEDILNNLNIKKIYLIDPYRKYLDCEKDGSYNSVRIAKKEAHKRLGKYNNIKWIEEYSEKAIDRIESKVDFIYVDGNHEYEYVKKDLELSWRILGKGGIISGHDIQCFDVSKAILEFANKNDLEIHFGDRRDWWIVKG